MEAGGCGNDFRVGSRMNLETGLAGHRVKADQGVQFVDKISRKGHGKTSLVKFGGSALWRHFSEQLADWPHFPDTVRVTQSKKIVKNSNPSPGLFQLHRDIDARVVSIRQHRTDWLCGKGCDGCCRSLAEEPQLTTQEWDLLRVGLAALAPEQLAGLRHASAALTRTDHQDARSVVCPLLDHASGSCPVYDYRPVACRSYGFYVQRDKGLYCQDIESQVAAGRLADVVWGNHDAIDRQLAVMGEKRRLSAWFDAWNPPDPAENPES